MAQCHPTGKYRYQELVVIELIQSSLSFSLLNLILDAGDHRTADDPKCPTSFVRNAGKKSVPIASSWLISPFWEIFFYGRRRYGLPETYHSYLNL